MRTEQLCLQQIQTGASSLSGLLWTMLQWGGTVEVDDAVGSHGRCHWEVRRGSVTEGLWRQHENQTGNAQWDAWKWDSTERGYVDLSWETLRTSLERGLPRWPLWWSDEIRIQRKICRDGGGMNNHEPQKSREVSLVLCSPKVAPAAPGGFQHLLLSTTEPSSETFLPVTLIKRMILVYTSLLWCVLE